MPYCRTVQLPDGTVAMVRFGGKRPACAICGRPSTKLCDYPVGAKTCDRRLCDKCAVSGGDGVDWCPEHGKVKGQSSE